MRTWSAKRLPSVAVGLAVFAIALAALLVLRSTSAPHYKLSAGAAIAAARADHEDARFLAAHPVTRAQAIPLDGRLRRVTFFDGPRVVLDAAVDPQGRVQAREEHTPGLAVAGAPVANRPWFLALWVAIFLVAVMVVPLWRMRNLDALALAAFAVNVLLINARLVAASVIVGAVLLAYLAGRCLHVAAHGAPAPAPGETTLIARLTAGLDRERRTRLLRILTGAMLLVLLAITLTSTGESDVAAASVSGATALLHGQLPYGHIIGSVVHGDTYPLLNYVAYLPGAAWLPVTDAFSDISGALPITAAATLIVTAAIWLTARRVAPGEEMRLALAWLTFPPVLLAASSGSNDLVLAACLAWLPLLLASERGAGLALALAAWVKVVPLILLPLWLARLDRRAALRALAPILAVSAACVTALVIVGGGAGPRRMIDALAFQFQRGSFFAPWYTLSLRWLQPIVQAGVIALVAWLVLRVRADRRLRGDVTRLAAASAALLLGVQLAANYWTGDYTVWVFPLLAVALLMRREGAQPAPAPTPTTARGDGAGERGSAGSPAGGGASPGAKLPATHSDAIASGANQTM